MDITITTSFYSKYIIVKADNVYVEESVSETLYALKEDGKKDFSKRIGEDITDDAMNQFTRLLSDLVYYRERDFDSSDLIEQLFERLPQDRSQVLLKKLRDNYEVTEEI